MTPKILCSNANLKKKQDALKNKRTTNHWPHRPKLFPLKPQTYGKQLPNVSVLPAPILTNYGKQIAGL